MADRRADADAVRARFLQVDTATVSDLLHGLGRTAQVLATDLAPLSPEPLRMGGWAYTIRGQMTPYEGLGDAEKMRAIEGVGAGELAVWAGETEGVCCFGELLALGMKVRGCAGARGSSSRSMRTGSLSQMLSPRWMLASCSSWVLADGPFAPTTWR